MYAQFLWEGMTRDFNDMVKYPGRFNSLEFDDTEGVIHKIIYADVTPVNLEPVDQYLVVKNMSTQNVTLTFNTLFNFWINPGTELDVTILPGQIVQFTDLDYTHTPTLTSASAAECEVILIGFPEWDDFEPGFYCDVWAVGKDAGEPNTLPLTVHHDSAGNWTKYINTLPEDSWLHDVAGIAANDYWAVGEQATGGLFAAWYGSDWNEGSVFEDNPQYGVWGFAHDDYWSVGGVEGLTSGEIWHWNGSQWLDTFSPDQESRCFFHVHGIAPDDCWAVGEAGMVYHWDGISWTEWQGGSFPATLFDLYGVWQLDADNLWVCGGNTDWISPGGVGGLIYHLHVPTDTWTLWNPSVLPTMHGLWGFGANDIYCVGNSNTVLHWDGTVWTPMLVPTDEDFQYRGVFGCYPWNVWAVGHDGQALVAITQWDTVSWTIDWIDYDTDLLFGIKGVPVIL